MDNNNLLSGASNDPSTPDSTGSSGNGSSQEPFFKVNSIAGILLISIVFNFLICFLFPLGIANLTTVSSEREMLIMIEKTISDTTTDIRKQLTKYKNEVNLDNLYREKLIDLENKYIKHINENNIELAEKTMKEIKSIVERNKRADNEYEVVTFMAFLENRNIYVWWLITTCLMFIILAHRKDDSLNGKIFYVNLKLKEFVYPILIWTVFYGLYFLRNKLSSTYEEGRRVFAYSHPDIDPYSSCYHAFIIFWFCYLCALLMTTFTEDAKENCKDYDQPKSVEVFFNISREATKLYEKWIFNSLILGLGFMGFLSIYKNLVLVNQDFRYYPSIAVVVILWCICWYCLSQPLIKKLLCIEEIKSNILQKVINDPTTYSHYDSLIKDSTFLSKQSLFISLGLSLTAILGSILSVLK